MEIAFRLLCGMVIAGFVAFGAHAQETERAWPSRQAEEIVDPPQDPAMGRGGRCRHEGERISQGDSLCLTDAGGTRYPALCGMSLNNTSWLRQDGACAD